MSPSWRTVAERADKKAYPSEQVSQAAELALVKDFAQDVPAQFVAALQNALAEQPQLSLFSTEATLDRVEALRQEVAGRPIGATLVDSAVGVAAQGLRGPEAVRQAIYQTLNEHLLRRFRQIEEHVLRESTVGRAVDVRERLEAAIRRDSLLSAAATLSGSTWAPMSSRLQKQSGLDDGVPL